MIKFNRYNVSNGKIKARVHYSLDNRIDKRKCVTIYAKDYSDALRNLFASEYKNDTDIQIDYFEKGKVVLFEDHPLYTVARNKVIELGIH